MMSDSLSDDADTVIANFLDGAPSADTWGSLRKSLQDRLRDLKAEPIPTTELERVLRAKRLEQLEQQVSALAQEEAITRFVEDSIRATISLPRDSYEEED